uniref:Transmembrane protein 9 n=1 Tax=Acrobeloides nanus TaxID=290746 RepID=A0A914CR31_9BILA
MAASVHSLNDREFFFISISKVIILECQGNFEDTRCRCTCPNPKYFVDKVDSRKDDSSSKEDPRRYYTKTDINSVDCNPQNVVKESVNATVDASHVDAFLANCDCRFESRNTVVLKVVVIFVICVMLVLGTYMCFLILLDPMLRRQQLTIPYHRQDEEIEENIFARPDCQTFESSTAPMDMQMRPRSSHSNTVLSKVEAEQNKWKSSVEEQRRKVMTEHSMLN